MKGLSKVDNSIISKVDGYKMWKELPKSLFYQTVLSELHTWKLTPSNGPWLGWWDLKFGPLNSSQFWGQMDYRFFPWLIRKQKSCNDLFIRNKKSCSQHLDFGSFSAFRTYSEQKLCLAIKDIGEKFISVTFEVPVCKTNA